MARKTFDKRVPRPRNPYFAAMRARKSGAHGSSTKALRRKARMELKGKIANRETFAA